MRLELVHRRFTRWFHWLNAVFLALMIASGMLIYWANDVYEIRIAGRTLWHFFPDRFYETFEVDYRLAEGLALHFVFMWLFILNGLVYVVLTLATGEWRALVPRKSALRDAVWVTLHELGLRTTLPPQGKYNAAQQIAYTLIVVAGAGSLITGLAIYKPVQLAWLTRLLGGYEAARLEHFGLMLIYVLFVVVHVTQVVRAGWGNFASMVMGYRIVNSRRESDGGER